MTAAVFAALWFGFELLGRPQEAPQPETEEETTVQVPGVYTLVGEQVEFKPVTVLEQGNTFALVEAAASGRAALQPGDVVVVAAEDLYDGKVIQ